MGDLRLPDHVRFCEIGGQRIFLDLRADRYFGLPAAAEAAFAALLQEAGPQSSAELDALRRSGLLVEAPDGGPIEPTRHPAPASSLIEEADLPLGVNLPVVAEVLLLVLRARCMVKRKRLEPDLGASRDLQPPRLSQPERRDAAIGAFLRARRLIPIVPNCLYDSLALRRFLRRRSIDVDLVIGVKLHPFAAHCWIQDGTTVLNDSLGSVREFEPILVA